jgi:ketosteroid isomerase-like protein
LSANADFVREWVAAWNRGDVHALIEGVSPDIEWIVAREHPDPAIRRGRHEVVEYLRDWAQTMPGLQIEIEDLQETGDQVLLVMRMAGSGAGSGAAVEVRTATLTTFRDGKPVRTEEFLDPQEARVALQRADRPASG